VRNNVVLDQFSLPPSANADKHVCDSFGYNVLDMIWGEINVIVLMKYRASSSTLFNSVRKWRAPSMNIVTSVALGTKF
jgi:hypothetical protein